MAYSFNYSLTGNGTFVLNNTQVRPDTIMNQWVSFNTDPAKAGLWSADNSAVPSLLRCTSATGFTGRYNPSSINMTDYTFSASVLGAAKATQKNLIGLAFRYTDTNHYYFFAWDGSGGFGWNGDMRLYKVVPGGQIQLAVKPSAPWSADSNYHNFKVTVAGNRIQLWVDNVIVFDYTDTSAPYLTGAYGPFTGFQEASYQYLTGTDVVPFSVSSPGMLSIPESSMDFASATYDTHKVGDILNPAMRSAVNAANADLATVRWISFVLSCSDVHATAWLGTDPLLPKVSSDPAAVIGSYTDISKVPPTGPFVLSGSPQLESIAWQWQNTTVNADGIELLDGTGKVIVSLPPTATQYVQTGLVGGQSYQLSVRAYNRWGKSQAAGPATVIPFGQITLYTQPPAPTNVSGVIIGNAITWTWIYPTSIADLVGFHLYDINGTLIANAGPGARSFTQRNILLSTPYLLTVKAYNKMEPGYGASSQQLIAYPQPAPSTPVPLAPGNLVGRLVDSSHVSWTWADASNGKGRFTLYDGTGKFVARIPAGQTSYLEAVNAATQYQRYVTSTVSGLESAGSNVAAVVTPPALVDAPITDVVVFDPNSVKCDWLPREGPSKIPAFKSGIGDALDLLAKVNLDGKANESFNYTMQVKAYVDQILRVYPARQFQFRFKATGSKPVPVDRGNFSAQLTLWPRRQATITLTATSGGQQCGQWTIPFNIWGYQVLTVAKLSDYPAVLPSTPGSVTYTYTVSGDSQVQVAWNSDHSALQAATSDHGTSANWAGQVTLTASDIELCTSRIAIPAGPEYTNARWTFICTSSDPTVQFYFQSAPSTISSGSNMLASTVIGDSIVIAASLQTAYQPWNATSDWYTGTVNGVQPMLKNGDGQQSLTVPVEMLLPNGLINLQYTVESAPLPVATPVTPTTPATPATPAPATPTFNVKFYLAKGTGAVTSQANDTVTFYCDDQDNVAVPIPWYGVITKGTGPYSVTEAGFTIHDFFPSPAKDTTALVYNNSIGTLKLLYNYTMLITCDNPNVVITYRPPVDWAPNQLNVAIEMQASIANPTQTPWHPLIHNGYYYLNQSENYLYAASDVKGEVKTLNGFAPVPFIYTVGLDAVKSYPPSTTTWQDNSKAKYSAGQLQSVDTTTVDGSIVLAVDSSGQYVTQGTFISDIKSMPYVASAWNSILVDYVNAGNSSVAVQTRSRNTDGTWTGWAPVSGSAIASPLSDALQYMVVLNRGEIRTPTVTTGIDQSTADFLQGEMTQNTQVAGFGVTSVDPAMTGTYTSRVFDLGPNITDMGTLTFDVLVPTGSTGATAVIYTASAASPNGPWQNWVALSGNGSGSVASPLNRYLRYQVRFGQGQIPGSLTYSSNFANDNSATQTSGIVISATDIKAAAMNGTYVSTPIDLGNVSSWGYLTLAQTPAPVGGSVVVQTISGSTIAQIENSAATDSNWQNTTVSGASLIIQSPVARYLKYRVKIATGQSQLAAVTKTDSPNATIADPHTSRTYVSPTLDYGTNVQAFHPLTSQQLNQNGSQITFTTRSSSDGSAWSADQAVDPVGNIASPPARYLKYTAFLQHGSLVVAQPDLTDGGASSATIQQTQYTSPLFNTVDAAALGSLTYTIPGGLPQGAALLIETTTDSGATWQALSGSAIQSPVRSTIQYRATMTPGYGAVTSKTVTDNAINGAVDSYVSGTLDFNGKVNQWDQVSLQGTIPSSATIMIYTASADTTAALNTPSWVQATSIVQSGTGASGRIASPLARYIKYRVDVTYAATPQATPATPGATPATPQATPVTTTWVSSSVIASQYQPFQGYTFQNVHMAWTQTQYSSPTLQSVSVIADTFNYVSSSVTRVQFQVNTFQYAAATLRKMTTTANTYSRQWVTPTVRSITVSALLNAKEFSYSYSTSLIGQAIADMAVHQVSPAKVKDIMASYLQTQGIDIATLNVVDYTLKNVDPSIVLSTTDYRYGLGYVMSQTTSMNPKPLINDSKVIYDYKTKSALMSPVPRQGAPIIVTDQRGYELRQVFFVDQSGNQSLMNTEFFTANGVSREVALKYQGVDPNSIQIYYDPNHDGNWVQDSPGTIPTATPSTPQATPATPLATPATPATPVPTTVQKNFALCNNTLSLPKIYPLNTPVKVTYQIVDSFYVDYNYDPKGVYAKVWLNNCIPIVDPATGLTTLSVFFETADDTAYYEASEINLNPMLNVIESGFVYLTDVIEPAVKLEIYTNPDVLNATGYDRATVLVMAKDRYGNPVIGETLVFDAVDAASAVAATPIRVGKGQIYTDVIGSQVAVTDVRGIARAIYLADYTPGNVILRVTDQMANIKTEKTIYLKSPNVKARISIEADKTRIIRDGHDQVLLTITLVGPDQRPVIGETVGFATSAGTLVSSALQTTFDGVVYAYLTVPATAAAGLITITASSAKYGIQQSIIINGQ